MNQYGDTGLKIDEIIQHASNEGLSEIDVEKAVKTLSDGGELYKSPSGIYKMA